MPAASRRGRGGFSFCAAGDVEERCGLWQPLPWRNIFDANAKEQPMDDKTQTELEAAVYRRLVEHLRQRTDVQNIDLMNLAGFCRNCLSNWLKDAADAKGLPMSKDESREAVYGMPYDEWKAKHQSEASPEQMAEMKKVHPGH